MSPDTFISDILDSINLVSFTVGDDFRFGQDRKGDTALLREWGDKKNILIENTETVLFEGERISSTRIRNALLGNNLHLQKIFWEDHILFQEKLYMGNTLAEQ